MKKIYLIFIALASVAFFSCKDNRAMEPEVVTVDHESEEPEVYAVKAGDAKFNDDAVAAVFNQYIVLQTALINTDGETAQKEAENLSQTIEDSELDSEGEMDEVLETMSATSDVKVQREQFETLNDWMESKVEGALESGTIYKQYCPMAFDDQGAYWLSTNKEILNPYFGDVMLHCGRVDSEIK